MGLVEAVAIAKTAAENATTQRVDEMVVRVLYQLEREIADLLVQPDDGTHD